ncbi:MazG-like family protein, partial [Streptomyces sp. NRRL S-495]|uniref:MazG-like family protein n=1 Tax=Streptomyces sp. NRRL S-495 TaxID=1609133 RepID=UPI0007C7CEAE
MTDTAAPTPTSGADPADDVWEQIARQVAWLDHHNGAGEHESAMRLMKLSEEVGEVMQAYIGTTGQNPRKGVTHERSDVADELCDVVVTALVALHRFTDDPRAHLDRHLVRLTDRLGVRSGRPTFRQWLTAQNQPGHWNAETGVGTFHGPSALNRGTRTLTGWT